jgi:hypothetical protein
VRALALAQKAPTYSRVLPKHTFSCAVHKLRRGRGQFFTSLSVTRCTRAHSLSRPLLALLTHSICKNEERARVYRNALTARKRRRESERMGCLARKNPLALRRLSDLEANTESAKTGAINMERGGKGWCVHSQPVEQESNNCATRKMERNA